MLVRLFKMNETVVSCGDKVRYIFFLTEGCTTLYDKKKMRILQIHSGSWYGDFNLFHNTLSSYTLRIEPP